MIPVRFAAAALALAILAAPTLLTPLAEAQTVANPLCVPPRGVSKESYCTYERQYIVGGRALDSNGLPAKGARVKVVVDQEGVVDAQGRQPTLTGVANCKGDFEFSLAGLRHVATSGRVRVTIEGVDGNADVTEAQPLEPFWRRNDVRVTLPYVWNYACEQLDAPWGIQVSVKGRLLNRTDAYESDGVTFHARAYTGLVGLYYWDAQGNWFCPPNGRGGCEPIATDELGNFKYTWTFESDVDPTGIVEVVTEKGLSFNATVDPASRLAVHRIEVSGRGPPPMETPAPALGLALVALALVARLVRRGAR